MIVREVQGSRSVLVRDDQEVHRPKIERHLWWDVDRTHHIVLVELRDSYATIAGPAEDAASGPTTIPRSAPNALGLICSGNADRMRLRTAGMARQTRVHLAEHSALNRRHQATSSLSQLKRNTFVTNEFALTRAIQATYR